MAPPVPLSNCHKHDTRNTQVQPVRSAMLSQHRSGMYQHDYSATLHSPQSVVPPQTHLAEVRTSPSSRRMLYVKATYDDGSRPSVFQNDHVPPRAPDRHYRQLFSVKRAHADFRLRTADSLVQTCTYDSGLQISGYLHVFP